MADHPVFPHSKHSNSIEPAYHIPVLLHESIDLLKIKPDGVYVDVTFGGGGHTKAILAQLDTGKVIAFDRDADAVENLIDDDRLIFWPV